MVKTIFARSLLAFGLIASAMGCKKFTEVRFSAEEGNDAGFSTIQFNPISYQVMEGNQLAVVVTRVGSTAGTASADLGLAANPGTASADTDYQSFLTVLNFAAGESFKRVTINTFDNDDIELPETINLALSNVTGARMGVGTATVHLLDAGVPTISFASTASTVAEAGAAPLTVTLNRTGPRSEIASVTLSASGTAENGADYEAIDSPQLIEFLPGETSKTLTITPLNDSLQESAETVVLTLSAPADSVLGVSQHTVTIADNDSPMNVVRQGE